MAEPRRAHCTGQTSAFQLHLKEMGHLQDSNVQALPRKDWFVRRVKEAIHVKRENNTFDKRSQPQVSPSLTQLSRQFHKHSHIRSCDDTGW